MKNGHKPKTGSGLLETDAAVVCAGCDTPMSAAAKFCPECGTQRTVTQASVGDVTTTELPAAGDATAADATTVDPEHESRENATADLPPIVADTSSATAQMPPAEPKAARWSRRRALLAGVGLVLVVALVFAGLTVFSAMNRQPVIAALVAASSEFSDAIDTVAASENLEAVAETAKELPGWTRAIDAQQQGLETVRGTAVRDAASAVLAAQSEYLEALRPLADLEADNLSAWPDLAASLQDASAQLADAGSSLRTADAAAYADADLDATAATAAVETAVALATVDNATTAVQRAVSEMTSAIKLADIRAAADLATESATELQAALETLETLADADATQERLTLQAAFLDELAGLKELTPDNLAAWDAIAPSLGQKADAMVAGLDLPAAETATFTADLRQMRASVAQRVGTGRKRLAAWRRDVRAAEAQRDEELAALATYESGYRTHMERYNDLRDSTADFTERIRSEFGVTYDEAYTAFYDGISQREQVRESMNSLSPPDSVRSHHLAVVGVIDDAIAAMQAAVDGLADSQYCYGYDCYYADTPGWQRFQDESDRITDEFASATASWDSAISGRRAELEDLELPKRPEI